MMNSTEPCEICSKHNVLTLTLHCGYQVCMSCIDNKQPKSKEEQQPEKKKDENKFAERNIICPVCEENIKFNPKGTQKNHIKILFYLFGQNYGDLSNNYSKYQKIGSDIDSKNIARFQKITSDIKSRKKEVMKTFEDKIDDEIKYLDEQLEHLKDVYNKEIRKKFYNIDIAKIKLEFDDLSTSKNPKDVIKKAEELIKDVDQKKSALDLAQKSIDKTDDLTFKKSKNELEIGELLYKNSPVKEGIFKKKDELLIDDYFNVSLPNEFKLPNFDNLSQITASKIKHEKIITQISQLPNGDYVTSSSDNVVKVWDKIDFRCKTVFSGHQNNVKCFTVLDNNRIASVSSSEKVLNAVRNSSLVSLSKISVRPVEYSLIIIWDSRTGREIRKIQGPKEAILAIEKFDENTLVTGGSDGRVRLWDIITGDCLFQSVDHEKVITSVKKLNDNEIITSSSSLVRLWKVDKISKLVTKVNDFAHGARVKCIERVDDNQFLTGSEDKKVRLWNKDSQTELNSCETDGSVLSIKYHDGKVITFSRDDKDAYLDLFTNLSDQKNTKRENLTSKLDQVLKQSLISFDKIELSRDGKILGVLNDSATSNFTVNIFN